MPLPSPVGDVVFIFLRYRLHLVYTQTKGGFLRAKLLLRFLGELLNCGLVEAQEYGDMLATLCAGYVRADLMP